MYPLPIQITKNQTSFFAHEVFEYFLPAQKVFRLAGERGEGQNCPRSYGSNDRKCKLKA
jgi:hypothetical protein